MKAWIGLGTLALAGALLFAWKSWTRQPAATLLSKDQMGRPEPSRPADSELVRQSGLRGELQEPARESTAPSKVGLQGRIEGSDGARLSGARVEWIALQPQDTAGPPDWLMTDWEVAERISVTSTTAPDGSFEFDAPPTGALAFGSVLLALHPAHFPDGLDLVADARDWPGEVRIRLERARPIEVQVVDSSGKSQPGALVRHTGRPRAPDWKDQRLPHRWEHFLHQQASTDSNGEAVLTPFQGEQILRAELGDLVSIPWQGPRPDHVRLTLGDSFTVGGNVTIAGLKDAANENRPRVLVQARTGNLWRPIACLSDVREGSWGPLRVPWDGINRVRVRLEGSPFLPLEEEFDAPPPSTHRRIDFLAEHGEDASFLVQDESGQPIPSAQAVVWWDRTDRPSGPERAEGVAGPDGTIRIGGVPAGTISYEVSAPGFGSHGTLEEVPCDRILVVLPRAGRLEGHCTHAGRPVVDFEVSYWGASGIRSDRTKTFFGRKDGSFELDHLKPGEWSCFAASPVFPCGRPVTVRIEAGSVTQVELELPTPIPGGGQILDAETGEPVGAARVQPFSSGGLERSAPWGPAIPAASDGTFELEAFVLGSNYLRIAAEGYADFDAKAIALNEDFLDWGDIRLSRPQDLVVSLVGIEELDFDASQIRATTMEGHLLPMRNFESDGTLRYENVPPGEHLLLLFYPDETWTRIHLQLDPGREWRYAHRVTGARKLAVRVLDADGEPPEFFVMVMVTGQEKGGIFTVRMNWVPEGGRIPFEGLTADTVQVWGLDFDGNKLATREVTLAAEGTLALDLRLGERALRVRVVDPEGAALSSAWVTLRSASGAEILGVETTDADGWASLHGAPSGPALLDVSHGILGRRQGIPIDASLEELEVVLEASGSLELLLSDGDEPLAGVAVRIETEGGVALSEAKQSDAHGRARFTPLGEGRYRLSCQRADCWTVLLDQDLAAEEHATLPVVLPRLADLELTVLGPDGVPVSGVHVTLASLQFGASVEGWLQENRIRASHGLTSSSLGKIHLEGLPHGLYTWSVDLPEAPASGTLQLRPGPNSLPIHLPDRN